MPGLSPHRPHTILAAWRSPDPNFIILRTPDGLQTIPADGGSRAIYGLRDWIDAGGIVADYVSPAITWADVTAQRDSLLAASDDRVLPDRGTDVERAMWVTYRQALRDLPGSRLSNPSEITFPRPPNRYST